MKFVIVIILPLLLVCGCCGIPDDINISVNDEFKNVSHILMCIKAKSTSEIIDGESYFSKNDSFSASWYILPDNTLLGLNLENESDENRRKIKQILLGETGVGFESKIRWDMQVKTLFQKLDLRNHTNSPIHASTISFEVGSDYNDTIKNALSQNCIESSENYDYVELENTKYIWLELPDGTNVQLCGHFDKDAQENFLKLNELLICNSKALFKHRVESWYSAQSLRFTALGKKIWGIDVTSSYYDVYKGMHFSDALKTLASANSQKINKPEELELKTTTILSNADKTTTLELAGFQYFKINDELLLLIKPVKPDKFANEIVGEIYLFTSAPDIEAMTTRNYLIEFEFVDLANPIMKNWYSQIK